MSANRELLDIYVERYNAGDLDGVLDLYAEDSLQNMPDGSFTGKPAIRKRLAQELSGFSDVVHTVRSFIEEGDLFADEWTFEGTHTNPVPLPNGGELAPTGKRIQVAGMEVVQVPPAMMKDFQAKTAPLLDAFLKRVPASEKPVKAFLAEVKRSS